MKPLDLPDIHKLRAAQGWLELGNPSEASLELSNLSPEAKEHPAVLELKFEIFAKQSEWDVARGIAETITKLEPGHGGGWLHLAYATRRCTGGSEQAAYDILHPVAERFPEEATIPYNLACYTCQLGRLNDARYWFKRALSVGDVSQLKSMALNDADLKPLWKEIPRLEPEG